MLVLYKKKFIPEQYKAFFSVIVCKGYQEACLCRFLFREIPSVDDIFVVDINEPFSQFYQLMVDILVDDDEFTNTLETDEYVAAHDYINDNFDFQCIEIKKEIWDFLVEHDFVFRESNIRFNNPSKRVW